MPSREKSGTSLRVDRREAQDGGLKNGTIHSAYLCRETSAYGAGGLGGAAADVPFGQRHSKVRHLLQRTTAHNRRQKTTFVSQFITHVLTKSSVNFNQGLRSMTRRFCAHWAKSYSAVLQASTTSKLYQISMAWIVKCYQVRSQSLKTTTAGTHAREKTQP